VTWASHVALTNQTDGTFHYAQRSEIGPQVDASPADGFSLRLLGGGEDPAEPGTPRAPWTMAGSGARFALFVHHDDAAREFAYDRTDRLQQFDKGWDEAVAKGWTVVSMKNDWKTVFPPVK